MLDLVAGVPFGTPLFLCKELGLAGRHARVKMLSALPGPCGGLHMVFLETLAFHGADVSGVDSCFFGFEEAAEDLSGTGFGKRGNELQR